MRKKTEELHNAYLDVNRIDCRWEKSSCKYLTFHNRVRDYLEKISAVISINYYLLNYLQIFYLVIIVISIDGDDVTCFARREYSRVNISPSLSRSTSNGPRMTVSGVSTFDTLALCQYRTIYLTQTLNYIPRETQTRYRNYKHVRDAMCSYFCYIWPLIETYFIPSYLFFFYE